ASLTGEVPPPLVQLLSSLRNVFSAKAPASRTAAARRSRTSARSKSGLPSGNGETLHAHGRRVGAEAEFEIVGGRKPPEHVDQITGDGHLAHRITALAVLDPEARGAAAVIAGHRIDAHADEVGDVEALSNVRDQRLGRVGAGRQMQVARPGRWRRR